MAAWWFLYICETPVEILTFATPDDAGWAVAARVADAVRRDPALVLGLASGRTPLPAYAELARLHATAGLDFSRVTTFNLDEFAGLEATNPHSYRAYMQAELFDHVSIDPRNIGFLNGAAVDLKGECRRYEDAIDAAGGIDLQILGIGANGHIGFNEPAEGLCANTHIAELTQATREANASRFGGDWTRVPSRALSMGMATILNAREIVLIATGIEKVEAVRGMVEGLITTKLPASILQVHPRVTVMLDRFAWSGGKTA